MKICPACQRQNEDTVAFCSQCGAVLPAASGQASPYIPPEPAAPARRGLSPWAWVGIGCGLLALLSFGGCAALIFVGGRQITSAVEQAQNAPLTEQQVINAVKPIPIYPGAQVDIAASKTVRAIFQVTSGFTGALTGGKMKMAAGAFDVSAPPDKVIAWYDQKFEGWRRNDPKNQRNLGGKDVSITDMRGYAKGDQQVQVHVGPKKGDTKKSGLMLILLTGVPEQ